MLRHIELARSGRTCSVSAMWPMLLYRKLGDSTRVRGNRSRARQVTLLNSYSESIPSSAGLPCVGKHYHFLLLIMLIRC